VLLDRLDHLAGEIARPDHRKDAEVVAVAAHGPRDSAKHDPVPGQGREGEREVRDEEEARDVLVQADEEDRRDVDQRHRHERLRDASDLRPDRAGAEALVHPEEPRRDDPEQEREDQERPVLGKRDQVASPSHRQQIAKEVGRGNCRDHAKHVKKTNGTFDDSVLHDSASPPTTVDTVVSAIRRVVNVP